MVELLIKKLEQDNMLTKEEFSRRCNKIMAFWVEEGKRFESLKKELVKDGALIIKNYCLYLEYLHKFKLLCEGKELSVENISKLNINEVFEFRDNVLETLTLNGD